MDRTMFNTLPAPAALPSAITSDQLIAPCKVCLVDAHELAGPLTARGHTVTLLTTGSSPRGSLVKRWQQKGVRLLSLPRQRRQCSGSPALVRSYRVYEWLRARDFDILHFPERGAPGYYSLLARRQGLAFGRTTFHVDARSPTLLLRERNGEFLDDINLLEVDALERRCIELADAVSGPAPVVAWMRRQGWTMPDQTTSQDKAGSRPLVSVCLVTHNRPILLRQALQSLMDQDYPNLEVILVDDGSTEPAAIALLVELEALFRQRGWVLVRQPNRYLGAARNEAARHARGDYLLFMDDDNVARPHEVSTLVRTALRTDADILTCLADSFTGEGSPVPGCEQSRLLFAGIDSLVGIARNCFGDANALVRRTAFERVGGFTEDPGVTHEDWEFFARAVLSGCRLEVVPEALYWYRVSPESMIHITPRQANYARSLRPYLDDFPPVYHDLLRLAQGQALRLEQVRHLIGDGETPRALRYRLADAVHALLCRVPLLRRMVKAARGLFRSGRDG
jgi:glycosyltransferase involved in cell wall biosynthesis